MAYFRMSHFITINARHKPRFLPVKPVLPAYQESWVNR